MASVGGEEVEYGSDPEEAKLSLSVQRREAGDVEEEEVDKREMPLPRVDSGVSENESNAAAEYDYEKPNVEEEEIGENVGMEEENKCVERENVSDVKVVALELDGDGGISFGELSGKKLAEKESDGAFCLKDDQFVDNAADGKEEVEKEEYEPFVVPTTYSYYMHDDRFEDKIEDICDSPLRLNLGGRKLSESKDDRRWVHDKFEELTRRERQYEEGRRVSRGRNNDKFLGEERAYPRNRTKVFDYKEKINAPHKPNNTLSNQSYVLDSQNNRNNVPDRVRGSGPIRYQLTWKKKEALAEPKQQSAKSVQNNSYVNSGRVSELTFNAENDSGPPRKHVSSSLNYASPLFYPSTSSSKEIKLRQKMDGTPLHQDMQLQDSESSLIDLTQTLQLWGQGKGQAPMEQLAYQPNAPHNQVKRVPISSQASNIQRVPNQSQGQALKASGQQFEQLPGSGNQTSSPPNAPLITNTFEPREIDYMRESTKSRSGLAGKAKGSAEGNGRSSFRYYWSRVMGESNNGSATGDKKFSANRTGFVGKAKGSAEGNGRSNFPYGQSQVMGASGNNGSATVMQFGGQHTGDMGVPAVGMAFPGYVGDPRNSEMTWLPVLAGAAGAMGATDPYLSDGAYNAHASGQTPMAAASSKEDSMNKFGKKLKPSQRPDLGKRQNKPRRYTEMKFDH